MAQFAFVGMPGFAEMIIICVILAGMVAAGVIFLVGLRRTGQHVAGNPNLTPCPDCGQRVSRRAPNCPKCGRPLTTQQD